MKSLASQLESYGAYHQDWRNTLSHFVGVPMVTFAIFLALSWLRFFPAPDLPITGATLFYLIVFLYYLALDWQIALFQAPVSLALLWLADRVALWPFAESLGVFLAAFLGGWAVQLLGHYFEGKRPALADNMLQIFNAPLFLTAEVLGFAGFRQDLNRPPVLSEAWEQEVTRRLAEHNAGRAETVPWEEVRARWESRKTSE